MQSQTWKRSPRVRGRRLPARSGGTVACAPRSRTLPWSTSGSGTNRWYHSTFLWGRNAEISVAAAERGVEECHNFGWCFVFKRKHDAEGKIMRVFVAGGTGALGRHLVPRLIAVGHEVTATTRTPGKVAQLRETGAEPVVVDGLDRDRVIAAVLAATPEVIVHEMTALADMRSLRKVDEVFATTNE